MGMRRFLGLLTGCAAAAMLTCAGGVSASAATGTLYVSGIPYQDPTGCHNGAGMPMRVHNDTDTAVSVYLARDCRGPAVDQVRPGGSRVVFGQSVYVEQR